jgi:hypothetical protein
MAVEYLNEADVVGTRQSKAPLNYSRTGYGPKIGTSWEILLTDGRWRRVYVMIWSNSGTAYIIVRGRNLVVPLHSIWFEKREIRP